MQCRTTERGSTRRQPESGTHREASSRCELRGYIYSRGPRNISEQYLTSTRCFREEQREVKHLGIGGESSGLVEKDPNKSEGDDPEVFKPGLAIALNN